MRERPRKKTSTQSAREPKKASSSISQASFQGHGERAGGTKAMAIWICLGLALAIVLVYAPVRNFDFINWDDPPYVSQNPQVDAGLTWQGVRWAFTTFHAGYWLPLLWLSYMLDAQFYGLNAGGFHVTNVLLHIANSILLFLLLRRMTGALGRSAFVAGILALHPLHVESVAWVTERKDVLSTLFWMLTVWVYIGWVRQPSRIRYGGMLVLFALGLMAKPMVVTLPVTLLLLDFWPLRRVAPGTGPAQRTVWMSLLREKLPLFAITLASSIAEFIAQRSFGAVGDLGTLPVLYRVGNALLSYVNYIGKMFWPANLSIFYAFPHGLSGWNMSGWAVAGAILTLTVVSLLAMRAASTRPYLVVGWLWYLVTLVPVIGLVQVGGQAMADRFTYVPLIGLSVMTAWGVSDLVARWRVRQILLTAAAGLTLTGCAITTSAQVHYWKDSVSIWAHALDAASENAFVHNNLSKALLADGRYDDAVAQFSRSLQLMPENADERNNFANDLAHHGRLTEAVAQYSEALRIRPEFPEAHNNMANALVREGKIAEAVTHYSDALRLKPDFADAHNGLGSLLARQGQTGEALAHYAEALRLDPTLADAHNNIGALLVGQGKIDDAIREFSEAVRVNPSKADFHYNLGVMFRKKGQIEEARRQFETALKLNPDYQQARQALDSLKSESTTGAQR